MILCLFGGDILSWHSIARLQPISTTDETACPVLLVVSGLIFAVFNGIRLYSQIRRGLSGFKVFCIDVNLQVVSIDALYERIIEIHGTRTTMSLLFYPSTFLPCDHGLIATEQFNKLDIL